MDLQVKDIMVKDVITFQPDRLVTNAAHIMGEENVGCLIITDGLAVDGIVTDRDLTIQCLGQAHDGTTCVVRRHMATPVTTVKPTDGLGDAISIMRRKQIKRLPVVHNNILIGLLSYADIAHAMQRTLGALLELEGMDAVAQPPKDKR